MEADQKEEFRSSCKPKPVEYHIAQANFEIRDLMNAVLEPHRLKAFEWRVLQSLDKTKPSTICELSERVVGERTFTGRTVDKLAERGLVKKELSASDRRFVQVTLSEHGAALLRDAEPDLRHAREQLLQDIGQEKIDAVIETLRKLNVNAARVRENHFD